MERNTNQKTIILDYLRNVKTHPSAEEVYLATRKKLPNISLGTVYRLLKDFKQKRKILEIPCEVGHYDGDISSHAHFICEKCGRIFDIFEVCKECNIIKRKRIKVGGIKNYQINFYGICKKCQKK